MLALASLDTLAWELSRILSYPLELLRWGHGATQEATEESGGED